MNEPKWNCETLKEYFDLKIDGYWRKSALRAELGDKALELARTELLARLDNLNHIKEQTKELQQSMLTRAEYSLAHQGLDDKFSDTIIRLNKLETQIETVKETKREIRSSFKDYIGYIVALLAILGFIIERLI